MTKKHDFHDLWRMYVSEKIGQDILNEIGIDALKKLAGTGTRASDRFSGMRRPGRQASTSSAQKIKQAQKSTPVQATWTEPEAKNALVRRQKGELTAPQRKKVVNALVRVAQQNLIPLEKGLIKPEHDVVEVILSVMEKLCVAQKYPIEWKVYSDDLRKQMQPFKQDPDKLIDIFEKVAEQIKDQGGIDADCDQITAKDLKQIQERENHE